MTSNFLEIIEAVVIQGSGPDTIILTTSLPNGCWPYNGQQTVKMDVAAGTGPEYLWKHLGIKVERVIKS